MRFALITLSILLFSLSAARAATPAEEAARIAAMMNERGPVTCRFTESRRFTFRKNPVVFEGMTLFIPGRGLLLAYESPEARRIGLSSEGVAVESDGKIARSGAPEGLNELPALYALDLEGLAKNSEVSFTVTGEEWSLFLTEKAPLVASERGRVERREKASIVLFGSGADVKRIEIVRPGTVTITIEMSGTRVPSEEEMAAAESLIPR